MSRATLWRWLSLQALREWWQAWREQREAESFDDGYRWAQGEIEERGRVRGIGYVMGFTDGKSHPFDRGAEEACMHAWLERKR